MKCLGCNKKCICKKCINDLCEGTCKEASNKNNMYQEEYYWAKLSTRVKMVSREAISCSGFIDWITKMTKMGYKKGEQNGAM